MLEQRLAVFQQMTAAELPHGGGDGGDLGATAWPASTGPGVMLMRPQGRHRLRPRRSTSPERRERRKVPTRFDRVAPSLELRSRPCATQPLQGGSRSSRRAAALYSVKSLGDLYTGSAVTWKPSGNSRIRSDVTDPSTGGPDMPRSNNKAKLPVGRQSLAGNLTLLLQATLAHPGYSPEPSVREGRDLEGHDLEPRPQPVRPGGTINAMNAL